MFVNYDRKVRYKLKRNLKSYKTFILQATEVKKKLAGDKLSGLFCLLLIIQDKHSSLFFMLPSDDEETSFIMSTPESSI
jgi:hypothetical protein